MIIFILIMNLNNDQHLCLLYLSFYINTIDITLINLDFTNVIILFYFPKHLTSFDTILLQCIGDRFFLFLKSTPDA